MNDSTITLDVRDDIRNGHEPFVRITSAAAKVTPGRSLLLIAPFEPVPLFYVLGKQGFKHNSRKNAAGDWEVLFTKIAEDTAATELLDRAGSCGCGCTKTESPQIINLDARGLEPPLPMVRILETLTAFPATSRLLAQTDRRPVHLYPILEERGFSAQTEEQPDGSFITSISRK